MYYEIEKKMYVSLGKIKLCLWFILNFVFICYIWIVLIYIDVMIYNVLMIMYFLMFKLSKYMFFLILLFFYGKNF